MPQRRPAGTAERLATVTEAVLYASAAKRSTSVYDRDGGSLSYADLRATTAGAAAGLVRRGVRTGDVAAVHVASVREYVLAVHTLVAAGAVAVPLPADALADELGACLTACDARLMVTTAPLADAALAAAERSRVRQVLAFGEVPATTPFAALLTAGPRAESAVDAVRDLALIFLDAGGYGRAAAVTHVQWVTELRATRGERIADGDVVVVPHPCRPDHAYGLTIDRALVAGATLVAAEVPGPGTPGHRCAYGTTVAQRTSRSRP